MKIDGGCHCGRVTYTAEIDPAEVEICHCTDCQTLSGSAFRVVVAAARRGFSLSGELKRYIKTSESGAKRVQAFCPECGTQIYSSSIEDEPERYNLRVGTARQRAELDPHAQYWCRSALAWSSDLTSLPRFEKE